MQAAVLRIKLRHLNDYAKARNTAAAAYDTAFQGIDGLSVPERSPFSSHVFHQYTLRVANGRRDALRKHLEAADIPAMVYYPVPCHLQNAYKSDRFPEGSLPVTETLIHEVISLPMSTELDQQQLTHITATVKSFFS
jgi:dTDP-4-amino-4,6-dideoxygalactose transaminase